MLKLRKIHNYIYFFTNGLHRKTRMLITFEKCVSVYQTYKVTTSSVRGHSLPVVSARQSRVTHSCDSAKGSELTWKQRYQMHFKRSEMPSLPIWRVSGSGPGLQCLPLLWLMAPSSFLFDDPKPPGIRDSCKGKAFDEKACQKTD